MCLWRGWTLEEGDWRRMYVDNTWACGVSLAAAVLFLRESPKFMITHVRM